MYVYDDAICPDKATSRTCYTYIVGQKNYFQFSSRVYFRVNEAWNMILWNIISTYHFNALMSKQCMKYLEPLQPFTTQKYSISRTLI